MKRKKLKGFLWYSLGGGLAFISNISSAYFLIDRFNLNYLFGSIGGYLIGLIFNFTFQAWLTFKTKDDRVAKRFILFGLAQFFGLMIYAGLIFVFINQFSINYLFSFVVAILIVYPINFIIANNFIFTEPRKTSV